MKLLTANLLLLALHFLAAATWPDTEEVIADRCRVADGEWAVLIANERFICWERDYE